MRELAQHRVVASALAATAATSVVGVGGLTEQHGVVGEDLLASHGQSERVQQGEPVQIRASHRRRGGSS
jgi:hypothetical protein